MKILSLKEMEVIEGGRFWGSDNYVELIWSEECGGWAGQAYHDYYVLGVRTTHETWGSPQCLN